LTSPPAFYLENQFQPLSSKVKSTASRLPPFFNVLGVFWLYYILFLIPVNKISQKKTFYSG